jgi:hypothetical protein
MMFRKSIYIHSGYHTEHITHTVRKILCYLTLNDAAGIISTALQRVNLDEGHPNNLISLNTIK